MFVRRVNGRAYLAECVTVGRRVVRRHLGPADPDLIELVALLVMEQDQERQEERQSRDEERQREEALDEHWSNTRAAVQATLKAAGYHNPNGRGWGRRRIPNAAD
jgi:hypothetical protein